MATHSRVLAWEIPWTEDPGELQSWGREESDTAEQLSMHTRTCPSHTPSLSLPPILSPGNHKFIL